MSYNDFWFIETRDKKNNLKRWFLWLILAFAFVSIGTALCVKSMYSTIDIYEVKTAIPAVRVIEAKGTNVNGYIKGEVRNNGVEDINGKYMKFEFYNDENINVGTEYIEIDSLKKLETKTYEVKFKYDRVESFIITVVDEKDN